MELIGTTMHQGKKLQEQQGSDKFLSQLTEPGNVYRLFASVMPFEEGYSIVTPALFARSCDPKAAKTTLYVCEKYEKTPTGSFRDTSPLARYSSIARIMLEAEYKKECVDAEETLKRDAERMGEEVDTVKVNKTMEDLKMKYFGGKVGDKNIPPDVRPFIESPRVHMFTTLVLVKLDKDGAPDTSTIKRCCYALAGNKRWNQLASVVKKADPKQLEAGFVEIAYDYSQGTNKKECGENAAFMEVPVDKQLATMHADWWTKNSAKVMEMIIHDPMQMIGRNSNFSYSLTAEEIIVNIKQYLANKRALVIYLDMDSKEVRRSLKDLLAIGQLASVKKFADKAKEILATMESEEAASEEEMKAEEDITGDVEAVIGEQTLDGAIKAAGGEDTLSNLLSDVGEDDIPGELG